MSLNQQIEGGHQQIADFLNKSGITKPDDIQHFLLNSQSQRVSKGDYLIREGQICRKLFFLHSGAISVFILKDGNAHVKDFSLANKFITSYTSFQTEKPSLVYLRVEQDAELTSWNKSSVTSLMRTNIQWMEFGKKMADYLFMRKEKREISLLLDSAETRYLKFLTEYPLVFQAFPQYLIASYLGIRSQSLSRIRKELSAK